MNSGSRAASILAVLALLAGGQLFAFATLTGTSAADSLNDFKVVAIDAKSATVTARDNETGNTFKFKVNDQGMLKAVKIGDAGQVDSTMGGM